MRLTNLRQSTSPDGPTMCADFTIADGRQGSVCIPLNEYDAHGEAALEMEAAACARQARAHGYRPPEADRFSELG